MWGEVRGMSHHADAKPSADWLERQPLVFQAFVMLVVVSATGLIVGLVSARAREEPFGWGHYIEPFVIGVAFGAMWLFDAWLDARLRGVRRGRARSVLGMILTVGGGYGVVRLLMNDGPRGFVIASLGLAVLGLMLWITGRTEVGEARSGDESGARGGPGVVSSEKIEKRAADRPVATRCEGCGAPARAGLEGCVYCGTDRVAV